MNYCYKVKSKFLKLRDDGSREIEEYFSKFVNEESGQVLYSIKYRLPPEADIVRGIVNVFNDPKWQKSVHLGEHLEDYEKEGVTFTQNEDGTFTLNETEEVLVDFEMIRLCVDMDDDDGTYGYLFILIGDGQTLYFSKKIMDKNIPDIIETLLKEKVIYKTLSPDGKLKRRAKIAKA